MLCAGGAVYGHEGEEVVSTFILHANDRNRASVLANAHRFLDMLPAGKSWHVEVKQHTKKRTDPQNRYLWGVAYATLCKHLPGWDAEDIHEYMLGEHFGWERAELLGRTKLRPLRRSSKLNAKEFAEFVDFIQRKAAEHGVHIPDPDPFYLEQAA